jgi:hypothetical protein
VKLFALLPLAFLVGCSLFTPKSALSVLDEAARLLCVQATAEKLGTSPEAIRETACKTEQDWRPFLGAAREAERVGAVKAGMAPGPLTPENAAPELKDPELEERK